MEVGHDPRQRRVVDHLAAFGPDGRATFLPSSPQGCVLGAETQPARLVQRPGGGLPVVVHERVELLHDSDDVVDPLRRQGLAGVGPVSSPEDADVAEEVQHEGSDPARVVAQPWRCRPLRSEPVGEDLHPRAVAPKRGPGQRPGLHGDLEPPLHAVTQPGRLQPVEVDAVASVRLMGAARDPDVEARVPDLSAPPGALVVGGPEHVVAAAVGRGAPSAASCWWDSSRPRRGSFRALLPLNQY